MGWSLSPGAAALGELSVATFPFSPIQSPPLSCALGVKQGEARPPRPGALDGGEA